MPRIDDDVLDCVLYLYPTVESAQNSNAIGGTGFLVGVTSKTVPNGIYTYAVTNSHVIREAASPIARLNTQVGAADIFEFRPEAWVHHPDGDDIAVAPIGGLDTGRQRIRLITTELFITPEIIAEFEIGPGDETFMVGRFVSHEGKDRNLPTVRFGNISMMPHEKVKHARGTLQESFLVETRSLGGYSGSPVFVHIPSGSIRPKDRRAGNITLMGDLGPWLLGIDFGHLPIYEPVFLGDRETPAADGLVARSNSGQMGVVPAWKLLELLNDPLFADARAKRDEAWALSRQKPLP
jgi:hypothetical protein